VQPSTGWRKVEVTGPLHQIKFPPICINCAAASSQTARIERLFSWGDEHEPDEISEVAVVNVPMCAACASRHWQEFKPIPFLDRLWPALKTERTIAFIFPFLTFLFFGWKALSFFFRAKFIMALGMMIPVVLFGLIAGVLGKQLLDRAQSYGVPANTSVSGCFTFSRDRKKLFEPPRRRFRFRNAGFAEGFIDANRGNLWDPRSAAAANASTKRVVLLGLLIAAAIPFVLWSVWNEFAGN